MLIPSHHPYHVLDSFRSKFADCFQPSPAFVKFRNIVKADSDPDLMSMSFNPRMSPYISGNVMYWFEREFLQYVFQELNIEKLRAQKGKLILANGKKSPLEGPQYLCNVALGKRLDLEVEMLSGGHVAFATVPKVFAEELRGILKGRDSMYAHL